MLLARKLDYASLVLLLSSITLTGVASAILPNRHAELDNAHHSAETTDELLIAAAVLVALTLALMVTSAVMRAFNQASLPEAERQQIAHDTEIDAAHYTPTTGLSAILVAAALALIIGSACALTDIVPGHEGDNDGLVHDIANTDLWTWIIGSAIFLGFATVLKAAAIAQTSQLDEQVEQSLSPK